VMGLGFTGLWALARHQMLAAANGFVAEQAALGGGGRVSAGLSPAHLDLTIQDLAIPDPDTGSRLEVPSLHLSVPSWKPWHLTAASATARWQGREALTMAANVAVATLVINPDPALSLDEIRLTGRGWRVRADRGWTLELDNLTAGLRQDPAAAARYHLQADLVNLIPDPALSADLAPFGLAGPVESLSLDARLTFAAPIDRHLGPDGPQLTAIDLTSAGLTWGASVLAASGQVSADPDGLAQGQITLDITRPQDLIAAARAMGLLSADQAGLVEKGLSAYADPNRPDAVKMTFKLAGGLVKLGPFPLGPAPRLNRLQRQ
jgi:hypothetical protein